MKTLQSLVLLLLSVLVISCAAPSRQGVRPDDLTFTPLEFSVPEVAPAILTNGIRVYLLEDPELPLIEITAMVGGGSLFDPAETDGRSALFAALLQNGGAGERGPAAFEEYLESLSMDFAVDNDPYTTTIDLSLLAEDLDKGLSILDDVLRRPRLDAGRFELLRNQALEGIRRQDDDPDSIASRALDRAIFAAHPFGRSSTVESVNAITRDDLLTFHRRHFAPDNLWLAISGDFDRNALLTKLEKIFGDWPASGYAREQMPDLVGSLEPAVWVAEKDVPQTTIRLGHVGIDKDNPDLQAVRVMNYILGGGGFNSRLLREIRSNRGLAYSTYSYFMVGRRLPGPFVAGSETKSASTMEVVRLMLAEIERIRTEPVSEDELALAKESLINSFVFAFNDTHQILTQQVRIDYFDYPDDYLQTYRARIAALTRDDILQAAKKYLQPDKLAVIMVGRTSEFDGSPATLGRPVKNIPLPVTEPGRKE